MNFTIHDSQFLPHHGCEINLSMKETGCSVLAGENGVGKSTLLRRLWNQTSLAVLITQETSDFFYDRTLEKLFSLLVKSSSKIQPERLDALVKSFNLDKKLNRQLSELSGGEAQAVKLCIGLAQKSNLYLLDEPSQYLDQKNKETLKSVLEMMISNQAKLLVVEHDLSWLPEGSEVFELGIADQLLRVRKTWTI